MTIEECLKKDGNYYLIECKDYISEFEMEVKDGKENIIKMDYGKRSELDPKDFSLKCDLYEDKGWN